MSSFDPTETGIEGRNPLLLLSTDYLRYLFWPMLLVILIPIFGWTTVYKMEPDERSDTFCLLDPNLKRATRNALYDDMLNGVASVICYGSVGLFMLFLFFLNFRRPVQFWPQISCLLMLSVVSGGFVFDALIAFQVSEPLVSILWGMFTALYVKLGSISFFTTHFPQRDHQFFVFCNCSLVSLFYLRSFPGHTALFVPAAIALWDLFAVWSPIGLLEKVQEKAGHYGEQVNPDVNSLSSFFTIGDEQLRSANYFNLTKADDSKIRCPVCYEELNEVRKRQVLICGHSFCERCISRLLMNSRRNCPYCREKDALFSFMHELPGFVNGTDIDYLNENAVNDETSGASDEAFEESDHSFEVDDEASEASDETSEASDEASEASDETSEVDEASEVGDEASEASDETSEVGDEASEASDEASEVGDEASEASDEASEASDEASKASDEAPEAGDEAFQVDDEASEGNDEASEESDEASEESDEASEESDEASEESDEAFGASDEVFKVIAEPSGVYLGPRLSSFSSFVDGQLIRKLTARVIVVNYRAATENPTELLLSDRDNLKIYVCLNLKKISILAWVPLGQKITIGNVRWQSPSSPKRMAPSMMATFVQTKTTRMKVYTFPLKFSQLEPIDRQHATLSTVLRKHRNVKLLFCETEGRHNVFSTKDNKRVLVEMFDFGRSYELQRGKPYLITGTYFNGVDLSEEGDVACRIVLHSTRNTEFFAVGH